MARLTEEMVVARTKQSDIGQVTKLNCWGSELSDVRLLRRMQNVEVLSLSVNKIRSLEDFQHCRNLVELFVRKNEIADLGQILYLQHLPKLKNLWLEENPCANEEDYRYTVLRALPDLKTLDKIPVQPEEVQDAMRRGRELLHPQDGEYWDQQPGPGSRDCSPPPAAAPAPAPYQRVEQQQQGQQPQQPPPSQQQAQPSPSPERQPQLQTQIPSEPSRDVTGLEDTRPNADASTPPSRPTHSATSMTTPSSTSSSRRTPLSSSPPQPSVQQGSPVGQRSPPRCAADSQNATFTRKPSRDYIIRNADDVPVGGGSAGSGGQYYYEDGEMQYQRPPQALPPATHMYEEPLVEEDSPVILRHPHRMSNGGYHEPLINQGDNSSSDGSGGMYRERSRPVSTVEDESRQTYDRNNRQTHERLSSAAQRLANDRITCNANQRAPYPRRPITRSSNLLSAVLCLVKELDYPSLEVVEMAVKCRMDELED